MDLKNLQGKLLENLKKDFDNAMIQQFRFRDGSVFNKSDKLRSSEFALAKSFTQGGEFKNTRDGLEMLFRSDKAYATIQEEGGFIKSKGRMHKYFWAKWYETNQKAFKIIALSVMAKGGVKIKARPYIESGIKEFEKLANQTIDEFIFEIIRKFNRESA